MTVSLCNSSVAAEVVLQSQSGSAESSTVTVNGNSQLRKRRATIQGVDRKVGLSIIL